MTLIRSRFMRLPACALAAAVLLGACTGFSRSYTLGPPSGNDLQALSTQVAQAPGSGPYENVRYDYAGTNPIVVTADDPISTFSLDVDDASFGVACRYVRAGHLPDEDSIRVEEFVNHFRYGTPAPSDGEVNLIADGAPTPFSPGRYVVRIAVRAPDVPARLRRPVRIVAAVDCSGSMIGKDRIGLVKQSLRTLLRGLQRGDQIGVVAFRDHPVTVLPMTRIRETEKIHMAIDGLEAKLGAGTDLVAGVRAAAQLAGGGARAGFTAKVVLCSDGIEDGWGRSDRGWDAESMAYAAPGVSLTTVGFGMGNYDDGALENASAVSGGRYAYIGTPEESRAFFGNRLLRALHTVAWNVRGQMTWDASRVKSYRLLGFENRARPDVDLMADKANAADVELGAGDEVTALYEIELQPGAVGTLGTFMLRYETVAGKSQFIQMDVGSQLLAPSFDAAPAELRLAAAVARFAEVLRKSPYAQPGDLARTREVFNAVDDATDRRGELPALRALAAKVQRLKRKQGAS